MGRPASSSVTGNQLETCGVEIVDVYGSHVDIPIIVSKLLAINAYGSKAEAICLKIIKYYMESTWRCCAVNS